VTEDPAIHKHAFWLYGVLIGVAIKEALETTVPHLLNPNRLAEEFARVGAVVSFPHSEIGSFPEILRLAVFIALVVRFYFGSAYYFGIVYEVGTENDFPGRNYGVDFVLGFLHFTGFIMLALTINVHTTRPDWFIYTVGFILMYDLLWWGLSPKKSTGEVIFWWMAVNVGNALLSGFLYLILDPKNHPFRAEGWALAPVIVVSIFDIGWMMKRRPFFEAVSDKVPRRKTLPLTKTPDPAEPIPE